MKIILNGEPYDLEQPISVAELVRRIGKSENRVAVERNREVVPHSAYDSVLLQEGDRIEIVQFVGGG
ncbi:MAG: sulfur carrier protein ThiS [Deltaproteobacteria bacterium]|nr:MAG: sulfur carrier protein ThiS [Deltaproteobacteria bacterium]